MSAPAHDPGPEQFQQFPPNRIIVIHPGSLYVRIGRASDLLPVKQLHCIARKRRPGGKIYRDLFVPPSIPKTKELIEELEECRLQISHTLQSCMQSNGSRRYATPPQQIAAFNRRSLPETVNDGEPWPQVECDIVVGDLVLDVDPELEYNVHFPYKRDLLKITGPKSTKIQSRQPSDPEDPFDAEFLRETGRKRETVDPTANENQQFESVNENQPTGNADEDIVVDTLDGGPGDIVSLAPGQVLGLDAAILQSIDRCSSEELKRKMYSSILIVGGGVKVHGLNLWLQNRLALQIPYAYKTEQLEIVTSPKDIDPASTVWKGAAVMSCLESAIELWINQSEWTKFGLKILRERAPFIW
ncbi:actin-related protein 8 [Papilio machaon]|uniref:actin-related protein 8 n=1 Tax=Papilio machaon TaxID=76193 RepID=UPI001E6631C8|nr:actin-related protein 8 [Papilio machaon]